MKKQLIYLIISMSMFCGCATDTQVAGPDPKGGMNATISLRVAGGAAPTRAMNAAAENSIDHIDILVFAKSAATADADAMFDYRAETTLVGDAASDTSGATKNFRVSLRRSADADDLQKLVVLANCHAFFNAADFEGKTFVQVMDMLVIECSTAWNSASTTYDPLPMWGEMSDFRQLSAPSSVPASIGLLRVHAAVDVVVSDAAAADFTLTGVQLYNPSKRGAVRPADGKWNSALNEVTAPSQPAGVAGYDRAAAPFAYNEITTAGKASKGVIYTFEGPAAANAASTTHPFLVVKGVYEGEESYYRIDFFGKLRSTDSADGYLPLLRNFRYTVTIDGVSGRGYPSSEAAAADSFTDISATTNVLDEGNLGNVVWDGRDYLGVTFDSYEIDNLGQTLTNIMAATNYSGGWTATAALAPTAETDWLTTTATGTGSGSLQPITMTVKPYTTGTGNRIATITVVAGRLRQTITITQRRNQLLSLEVGDVEAIFSATTDPAPFALPIEWKPATTPVKVEIINPGTAEATAYADATGDTRLNGYAAADKLTFPASAATGWLTSAAVSTFTDTDGNPANGGMRQLYIDPNMLASITPFTERRAMLKISSDNGADVPIVKGVLLRQFDYAIQVTGVRAANDYQLSTTYTFQVRSNGEWEVIPSGNIFTPHDRGGEPNSEAVPFSFKTGNVHGATATLTFKHKERPDVKQVVTIDMKKHQPNCYILYPESGQKGTVEIPISKVFDLWDNDIDLNGSRAGSAAAMNTASTYTTELVWQDAVGLIKSIGSLVIPAAGTIKDASFKVEANTAGTKGNALVALKENGVIRWSWHIWVCGFDPKDNTGDNSTTGVTLMDRNLGATTSALGTIESYGLYYQWGRSTPFPRVATIYINNTVALSTTNEMAVYPLTGSARLPITTNAAVNVVRNLDNAIMNPRIFYYNTNTTTPEQDWYTNKNNLPTPTPNPDDHRLTLWDRLKTDYDPCPEGWQIPQDYMLTYCIPPSSYNYGASIYDLNGFVGNFPFAGIRNNTGGFQAVGQYGYSWHYIASSTSVGNDIVSATILTTSSSYSLANGYPVRCAMIQ